MRRVVSLGANVTAIVEGLGRLDRLVAVTKDCKRLTPAVAGLPVVGDSWSAEPDELTPLRADLVIGASPYRSEVVANLIAARTRFVATAAWGLAELYDDIRVIGRLLDAIEPAEALIAEMEREIEAVRARVAGRARPRVYCEVWMRPVMSSPKWVYELIDAAGGEPALPAATTLAPEAVIDADPDIVLMAWCGAIGRSNPREFEKRSGYDRLRAVVEGRIVPLRDEYLNAPCQHLLTGLKILAATLHSEVFGELPGELQPIGRGGGRGGTHSDGEGPS